MTVLELSLPFEISNPHDTTVTWYVDSLKMLTLDTRHTQARPQGNSSNSSSSSESSDDSAHSEHSTSPLMRSSKGRKTDLVKPIPFQLSPVKNKKAQTPDKTKVQPAVRRKTIKAKTLELKNEELNPPDVQRIVVEHVIKNDTSTSHSQSKWLRSFSGKTPKPPGEADFDVDLMFQDGVPIDIQRRNILESLLPPASDVVKQLGSSAHPKAYLKLLNSAYGVVEDGDEIFARFLNTHQNSGEKASDYLQRLQVLLSTAVKRDGLCQSAASHHLVKQFQRGCWDHTLILQLELKSGTSLDFAELLLQLRTEEDRRAAKLDRMHRHFGASKPKAAMNVHTVPDMSPYTDPNVGVLQAYISETESSGSTKPRPAHTSSRSTNSPGDTQTSTQGLVLLQVW